MIELAFLPKLLSVHMTATASPGPNFAIVSQVAVEQRSLRNSLGVVAGVTLGVFLHATIALLGVARWMAESPTFATLIKGVASIFLGYLGYLSIKGLRTALRDYRNEFPATETKTAQANGFLIGLSTCVANPKAFFYFATVLPQTFKHELVGAQLAIALVAIPIVSFLWFSMISYIFQTRFVQQRERSIKIAILAVTGFVFLTLSVTFARDVLLTNL